MDDNCLPHKLLVCSLPSGKRSVGGQKCRWNDLLSWDLKKIGLSDDWRSRAMDRNEWKRVVREGVETTNECEESQERKQKD